MQEGAPSGKEKVRGAKLTSQPQGEGVERGGGTLFCPCLSGILR